MRGLGDFLSSILQGISLMVLEEEERVRYNVVLILSKGVTASNDSVTPAPKPAMTVLGPEIFPSASCNRALYWSNATNPIHPIYVKRLYILVLSMEHTDSSFQRIPNNQRRAPRIPRFTKRWPWQLCRVC
jgi:hypothetical protein